MLNLTGDLTSILELSHGVQDPPENTRLELELAWQFHTVPSGYTLFTRAERIADIGLREGWMSFYVNGFPPLAMEVANLLGMIGAKTYSPVYRPNLYFNKPPVLIGFYEYASTIL